MITRALTAGASGSEVDRVQADLAYSLGRNAEALARYKSLLKIAPKDPALLERAGIAAAKLKKMDESYDLLSLATAAPNASWRAWNALGVVADNRSNWELADQCYGRASELAPAEPAPVNNRGWSLLLRGQWKEALPVLERAAAMNPRSERARNNVELVRSALAPDLPKRGSGESDAAWAAELNDAGMAAAIRGDRQRAVAAFSQALNVSGTWYARAASNLEALGKK